MTFHVVFLLLVSLGKNDNLETTNQVIDHAIDNDPLMAPRAA